MKKITFLLILLISSIGFSQDYTSLIQNYLNANRSENGLQPADISDIVINSQSYSKSMKVENLYVDQRLQGIPVLGTTSPVAIKNGTVVYAAFDFKSNLTQLINTTTPSITPQAAIVNAASRLNIGNPQGLERVKVEGNAFVFNKAGISINNIPVALVFESTENGLRLAWDLSIYQTDGSHYYSVRVDAVTGALLSQNDWVVNCNFGSGDHDHSSHASNTSSILEKRTLSKNLEVSALGGDAYRVFPLPIESPNHGNDELVINPANTVASPFGWHDTDGVAGAEFTITRGNNVLARDDINADNAGGESPDGGSTLTFDFPYQFDTNPVNMLDAATTNLFYWNNIMHDVWYQYGFDEESGNFQANNYGNGGTENDFVDAQAQDGGGTNNANFSTPPDGNNPRMQMFLWNASGPAGEPLTINTSGPLMGGYNGVPAGFGSPLPEDMALVGDLALAIDNNAGASDDENDACDVITNGAALTGNIAVIRRGECQFGFKVLAAETEGAIAVIVVNNVAEASFAMAPGDVGDQVTIPSIMVNNIDGEAIIAALQNGDPLNGSLINDGPYMLDGDLDNGIIAHEYGHGISNRLTGGRFNSNCLSSDEQMGEGWSDYFGLMLTMQDTDTRNDINGIGTYATGQPTDGGGIREAPYSTDFAINDFTFDDIDGNVSVPHGVGFVWATMLWEMTWDLVDLYGFDSDIYNGTGGNNIAMQLVIDGLKLQGCNPGFIAGRDAILEADMLANNGENQCLIWAAFARRGLGLSADGGSAFNLGDQTEGYDVPTSANCLLASGENSTIDSNFVIFPNPSNGIVNIRAIQQSGDAQITIYDVNGRVVISQEATLQNTVSINAQSLITGIYIITIEGDNYTHTAKLIIE
ncbi:T9SS-dependent M36 family metallopeptidase [Patiriisocius marinus]|uniref:T9SS-dependent M36 family metallopeptidase n=1 Tax=Patiriisocius marinus TaxID=1397112 RepID=UPI00232E104C|nr:T9SS-dependent M36 family metallopeptidase [Patiriisocius marinus]